VVGENRQDDFANQLPAGTTAMPSRISPTDLKYDEPGVLIKKHRLFFSNGTCFENEYLDKLPID